MNSFLAFRDQEEARLERMFYYSSLGNNKTFLLITLKLIKALKYFSENHDIQRFSFSI